MFADPQSVTVNSVAQSLARTSSSDNGGKFAKSDRSYKMEINHQYGRRQRHQIKLTHDLLVANPLISGQNVNSSISAYLVVDLPVGFDTATAKLDVDGFVSFLAASSGSAVTKLLGGES